MRRTRHWQRSTDSDHEDNHDMIFAYLLHLAHLVDLQYTLFLPAGTVLKKKTSFLPILLWDLYYNGQDYAVIAMTWYQQQAKQLQAQCICYTNLIPKEDYDDDEKVHSPPVAMWFKTREHALRMSVLLREFLPFQKHSAAQLLSKPYCGNFVWNTTIPVGPALFTMTMTTMTNHHMPWNMTNHTTLGTMVPPPPAWIGPTEPWNQSTTAKPPANSSSSSYQVVFAAPTMNRTKVGLRYVQQFLDELL